MDAVEQARAAAPEQRPGLRKLARETAAALGSRGETAEQRATRIETLSHIANLERDKEAVDFAREALDDMTTPEEQAKAMEATKVEAAERLSQDVRGEFREGTGAEAASPHDTNCLRKAANGMTLKEGLQHVAETIRTRTYGSLRKICWTRWGMKRCGMAPMRNARQRLTRAR